MFSCNIQALCDKLLTVHCVKHNLVWGGRFHLPVFLLIDCFNSWGVERDHKQSVPVGFLCHLWGCVCLLGYFLTIHPLHLLPYLTSWAFLVVHVLRCLSLLSVVVLCLASSSVHLVHLFVFHCSLLSNHGYFSWMQNLLLLIMSQAFFLPSDVGPVIHRMWDSKL